MDAVPRTFTALVHQQTAQPRKYLDHDLRRAGAGVDDRHAATLFGKREIRFRIGLSYPDLFVSRIVGSDVPFADQ